MEWVVLSAVLLMTVLCLLKVNVILSILISTIAAGLMSGLGFADSVELLVAGMGNSANTALSYILLGAFAVAISYTGITKILVNFIIRVLTGKKTMMLFALAGVACLSQNAVPVHIAFIPILIPPLLKVFDQMRMDRRAVALALTFGLKAPYVMIPAGFGLLFQRLILDGLNSNGGEITLYEVTLSMLIPGSGMIVGLLIGILFTYRKDKASKDSMKEEKIKTEDLVEEITFGKQHVMTIIAIISALIVQIITQDLILGALTGIIAMFVLVALPFKKLDSVMAGGISMMGMISFIIFAAAGFANVLQETGAVSELVEVSVSALGNNKPLIAFVLLLLGLVITIGIGTSFGTIPIVAALFVPICLATGFSPLATAALVGTAGALGDAGSPASDSTLGPTSGLNADGKHDHIWDTCVPTFIHYNIPLFIFGWIAAMVL
ncbi:sodium:proton antiporter [Oceanobacillus oncorhynchi subsp. incaldanensis]|uniref:Na+/H+ antiporter family protein n=1 Tax=Oceanobacillus oncorhynchi TaxID=545501 RepID=A0A0A1MJ86_9BACI|nr:Na+/H+ antiporter NhaC family protein [Oceanobacillus oncorhynchi]UUI41623.1 SLC13 family permease [Oceanobacillus oncorhynchi]GIO17770.1 sodium:proton antiporter [Oceanobacillus oncorhynchi subsp. incaldanensis]CEI83153.1 Na+/H+ antiporter family protein [Oceanobacillus oncorhynchi]